MLDIAVIKVTWYHVYCYLTEKKLCKVLRHLIILRPLLIAKLMFVVSLEIISRL